MVYEAVRVVEQVIRVYWMTRMTVDVARAARTYGSIARRRMAERESLGPAARAAALAFAIAALAYYHRR